MGKRRKLDFRVGGRYGYYAVDVYDKKTGAMLDTAIYGITKKEANMVVSALQGVQGTRYQRLAKSVEEVQKQQKKKLKKVI